MPASDSEWNSLIDFDFFFATPFFSASPRTGFALAINFIFYETRHKHTRPVAKRFLIEKKNRRKLALTVMNSQIIFEMTLWVRKKKLIFYCCTAPLTDTSLYLTCIRLLFLLWLSTDHESENWNFRFCLLLVVAFISFQIIKIATTIERVACLFMCDSS